MIDVPVTEGTNESAVSLRQGCSMAFQERGIASIDFRGHLGSPHRLQPLSKVGLFECFSKLAPPVSQDMWKPMASDPSL
jgi:hypothetical protein